MAATALGLIVLAAFIHAYWNFLVKRAAGGATFAWLFSFATAVLYFPLVLWLLVVSRPEYEAMHWLIIFVSGVLHLLYAVTLSKGYMVADLSVVYPTARGTGPLLSTIAAILILGERPSLLGYAGIVLIMAGVLVMAVNRGLASADSKRRAKGILYGALTGLCIASYTINDAYAVKVMLISPVFLDYFGNVVRLVSLTPSVNAGRQELIRQWRLSWRLGLAVGVLAPISYVLALYAMQLAPVSYVAPARELSMLIGAMFGAKLLGEGHVAQKLLGALLMISGITSLALS